MKPRRLSRPTRSDFCWTSSSFKVWPIPPIYNVRQSPNLPQSMLLTHPNIFPSQTIDIASHDAKYLSDERFIAYLKYLSYFKEPQYSRHLLYVLYQLVSHLEVILTTSAASPIACSSSIFFWMKLSSPNFPALPSWPTRLLNSNASTGTTTARIE